MRSTFVAIIGRENRDCDNLSDEELHRIAEVMSYAGATGSRGDRLALAHDFCKYLRTHLSFDEVNRLIQTPDARLNGSTPLQVLATLSPDRARLVLQPIMMEHLLFGVRKAHEVCKLVKE